MPLELCRPARELWWGDAQNEPGTPEQLEAVLQELPRGDEVVGVDEAFSVGLNEPGTEEESIEQLKDVLRDRFEDCVAVVCHWGVINALCGASASNAMVVECKRFQASGHMQVTKHRDPPNAPMTR